MARALSNMRGLLTGGRTSGSANSKPPDVDPAPGLKVVEAKALGEFGKVEGSERPTVEGCFTSTFSRSIFNIC